MQFTYHINKDERGEFEADVRNPFNKSVFSISGGQIFEDGFMQNKHDVAGLQDYLRELKIISPTDTIKDMEEATQKFGRIYRNQLHDISVGEKMQTGGGFSLDYLKDPEYIKLNDEYLDLQNELKALERDDANKNRAKISLLSSKLEHIMRKKKHIAMPSYTSTQQIITPIRNAYYKKKLSFMAQKGGIVSDEVEEMLEEYEPEFQYFDKSEIVVENVPEKKEKKYTIYFNIPHNVLDKLQFLPDYRDQAIEHFKNFGNSKKIAGAIYDIEVTESLDVALQVTQLI